MEYARLQKKARTGQKKKGEICLIPEKSEKYELPSRKETEERKPSTKREGGDFREKQEKRNPHPFEPNPRNKKRGEGKSQPG